MRKLFYLLCLLAFVSCDKGEESIAPEKIVESFEGVIDGEYAYGFHGENVDCEHFYNDEYNYWGGFALSKVYDRDAANGKYENLLRAITSCCTTTTVTQTPAIWCS